MCRIGQDLTALNMGEEKGGGKLASGAKNLEEWYTKVVEGVESLQEDVDRLEPTAPEERQAVRRGNDGDMQPRRKRNGDSGVVEGRQRRGAGNAGGGLRNRSSRGVRMGSDCGAGLLNTPRLPFSTLHCCFVLYAFILI